MATETKTETTTTDADPTSVLAEQTEFVLMQHEGLPPDRRPTITFRWPTAREERDVEQKLKASEAADITRTEEADRRLDAFRPLVIGWRGFIDRDGQPIPFAPDRLDDVVSFADLTDLHANLVTQIVADQLDRKRAMRLAVQARERAATAAAKT